MAWIRQSAGVYKNDQTGEVRNSATKPTDNGTSATSTGASTGLPNSQLEAAKAKLQAQVNHPDPNLRITQEQMNAELGRLQSTGYGLAAPSPVSLGTPQDVINVGTQLGKNNTQIGNQLNNPNQINPFGSQTTTYDANGTPTVTQSLSQPNQQILGGVQQGSVTSNQVLQQLLGGFQSLTGEAGANGPAPQSNYESAVFQQLTRDLDKNKAKDQEQLSQTLSNRGIPMGSQLYNDQMAELNKRYDDQFANARSQAVTQGTNTALGAIPTFSQTGQSGFMTPSFQGFQGQGYQGIDTQSLFNQLQNTNLSQQQLDFNKSQAGKSNGGGSSKPPQSAFNA